MDNSTVGTFLRLTHITAAGNDDGVAGSFCDLTVDHSILTNNTFVGLGVGDNATFHVTNNFIIKNGTGAAFQKQLGAIPTGTFEFNTVAGNSSTGVYPPGVICSDGANPLDIPVRNNVVFGNTGGPSILGCLWTFSDIEGALTPGAGNINMDPQFTSPSGSPANYHLVATSPAKNVGQGAGAPATDFDGDPRPTGAGVDMGADEVVP